LSAGALRGRVLAVPGGVRPTEGRVREALFDILGPGLGGTRFLDLFAGSGAVGLEALSRGAGSVTQVDSSPIVVSQLQATYRGLALADVACRRLDLPEQMSRIDAAPGFDRVFADPPYDFDGYRDLIAGLHRLFADPEAFAVVEHDARRRLPEQESGIELFDFRRYGESALAFYRSAAPR
jgi:16S rRNA (guanine966-N2)-methyltransferase